MKHVLVTGGTDGLGKAAAEKLIEAGYRVTILGHDEAGTKAAAEELGCKSVLADVSDYKQVEKAFAEAGEIDILINNAGIWIQDALEQNDPEYIRNVIEVNTLGVIYCTHAVLPGMKQRGGGRIINVISQAGLQAKAERAVYGASKWAITGFTKCMQLELKPANITVTGFYPGAMNTHMFEKNNEKYARDMSRALDPSIAADSLVYVCGLPDHVHVPELGIQSMEY